MIAWGQAFGLQKLASTLSLMKPFAIQTSHITGSAQTHTHTVTGESPKMANNEGSNVPGLREQAKTAGTAFANYVQTTVTVGSLLAQGNLFFADPNRGPGPRCKAANQRCMNHTCTSNYVEFMQCTAALPRGQPVIWPWCCDHPVLLALVL